MEERVTELEDKFLNQQISRNMDNNAHSQAVLSESLATPKSTTNVKAMKMSKLYKIRRDMITGDKTKEY